MILGFKQLFLDIKDFVADSLFPMFCLGCELEGSFLCEECALKLELAKEQCVVCHKLALDGITHDRCKTKIGIDQLYSVFDYHDELVARLIISGKYKFLPDVYEIFGRLMAQNIRSNLFRLAEIDVLVPIPLHSSRLRWRGFNQSDILAKAMGKETGVPVRNILERTKKTKIQKDLGSERIRQKNIDNAFSFNENFDVKNLNVAIIDDVVTTGSTLKEAAKIFKNAGACRVTCLTVARD